MGDNDISFFNKLNADNEDKSEGYTNGYFSKILGKVFGGETEPTTVAPPIEPTSNGTDVRPKSAEELRNDEADSEISALSSSSSTARNPSRKSSRLRNYNDSNFKQYWMPDSTGKECYQCEERFTTFRRRHHCRLCGQIFCAKCCGNHIDGSSLGYIGELRLCNFCTEKVKQLVEEKNISHRKSSVERKSSLVSQIEQVSTVSDTTVWLMQPNRKEEPPRPSYPFTSTDSKPTQLSVQQLYSETPTYPSQNKEEDNESGPDWFRSMNVNTEIDGINSVEGSDSAEIFLYQNIGTPQTTGKHSRMSSHSGHAILPPSRDLNEKSSSHAINDKFGEEFGRRTRNMVQDLLSREDISSERWLDQLLSIGEQVVSKIKCDSVSIANQVHIKKLLVEIEKPTSTIVWGTVCSKSLLHEEMIDPEPREESVMLVSGSIEYERITNKLSSIEPIINQEKQFLEKQVERIMAKRASLIIVEGDVTRIAAQLLHEHNVRIALFTKTSVLHRISRCTGADVISQADAQVLEQNHGFCSSFQQQRVLLKNGAVKSLLVFSGCSEEIGCTILLRSSSVRELVQVKRILRLVITILYSNRLEKVFLSTLGVDSKQLVTGCAVCSTRFPDGNHELTEFEACLNKMTMSTSPFISATTPFLESSTGKKSPLLVYFKQPLYKYNSDPIAGNIELHVEDGNIEYNKKSDKDGERKHPFSTCSSGNLVRDMTKSFRALGSVGALASRTNYVNLEKVFEVNKSKFRPRDVFDPRLHQRVAILFGSMSRKSPNAPYFCVRPWVVSMHFYEDHDMTLGDFLTKYCFNKSYECPSSNCDVEMSEHSRKLVFSNVCIEITMQSVPEPVNHQGIIFWQNCTICNQSSSIVLVEQEFHNLSFAKFLDYLGNGHSMKTQEGECTHCCLHQKNHFFAFSTSVCSFKVTKINPFRVQFSPMTCSVKPKVLLKKESAKELLRVTHQGLETCEKISNELDILADNKKEQMTMNLSGRIEQITTQISACKELSRMLLEDEVGTMKTDEEVFDQWRTALVRIQVSIAQLISFYNKNIALQPETNLNLLMDPFYPELHLTIPLPPNELVIIRDVQDQKGVQRPDIGSVIAYALSVVDNEKKIELANSEEKEEETESLKHVEIEFHDDSSSYFVKIFYAREFHNLRCLLFADGEKAFIRSLSKSSCWTPQGGKSGSFFYRTEDDRFIMKQMSKFEIESFVKFGPNYLDYLVTASTEKKLTALCKVYGVFKIGIKNKSTQLKTDILVMEYLFYNHDVSKVWDLKGSLRNRFASAGKSSSVPVLLDENFVSDLWNQQLYVLPHSKAALSQAISNDSHFLSSQYVMDYSLLVGVNDKTGELVLGIVDYMRTYTLDKKLESWVKIVAIPGAHLPTILSPEMYCARFSEAIDSYFPVAPDQWTGLGTVGTY